MALTYEQVKAALGAATIESGGTFIPFDVSYFAEHYGTELALYNAAHPGTTALQYYVEVGAALDYRPNAWFDQGYYTSHNPDLLPLAGSADLLVQYAKFGVNEGRSPSAALNNFDGARYLSDNPDVKAYVDANLNEFKTQIPGTNPPQYVSDAQAETQGAISHYVKFGAVEGRIAYDTTGAQIPFTIYPLSQSIGVAPDAATHSIDVTLETNGGHTQLTGDHLVANGATTNSDGSANPTLHLTGDASIKINVTSVNSQVTGIDLNGDGVIATNGVENNVSGAGIFTAKNFTMFDAYARDPLNTGDSVNNYLGNLNYDGTGYAGTGAVVPPGSNPTNGNIVLGGLGADNILGGLGNDFLAGGGVANGAFNPTTGTSSDYLQGGRNSDFMFAELSLLNPADGNNTRYDGGNTTDANPGAGLPESQSGANTQNNDWILLEAHDDSEPVTVDLNGFPSEDPHGGITLRDGTRVGDLWNIESVDASGNLYGFLDNSTAVLGSRASTTPTNTVGSPNFTVGSTAQLNIIGNNAANIIVGGYDNDTISGGNGNDILFGSNLGFLEQYKNNPNLINANGGLHLNVTPVGTVNGGTDVLNGNDGSDSIDFQMTGGQVNGWTSTPLDPQNRVPGTAIDGKPNTGNVVSTGDTLYLDSFSVGRVDGATYTATAADPGESAAQAAALAKETTDSVVRFDLGLATDTDANPSGSSTLMYRNYGGADLANNVDLNGWTVHSQDNTNYAPGMERTLVTGIESVITTGLGAIDYVAAGTDKPNLVFNNQQNFQALNATLDLRGIDGGNNSGTSRVFGLYTATNFGNNNPSDPDPAAASLGVNRADNVLYANTGNDVLEGRGGADFLSGGKGNDDFIFAQGDNTDILWRQQDTFDANGNALNLWAKDANGNYLYTQDFRPAAVVPNQSELDIRLEATNPGNQPTITVDHFAIRVGITEGQPDTGTLVEVTDLGTVGDFQQLAIELDAKLQLQDPNLHAVWDGPNAYNGVLKITDAIGRNISDTANEGYRFSASFTNLTVTNQASFVAHPAPQVENDRLILKSYLDGDNGRHNNVGVDTQHSDLTGLNANEMVVGFKTLDGNTTTLANNQEWRVQFEKLHVGDVVSVSINGKEFKETVNPGESTFAFVNRFAGEINGVLQLDTNSSAGQIVADAVHTNGIDGINSTPDQIAADGVLVLTQGHNCDPVVFMHTPVVSITNTVGATSGTFAIADTSGNSINLYKFDGSNGNLNAADVLFVGTVQNPLDSHATTAPSNDPSSPNYINKTPGAIDQQPGIDSKEVLATALNSGGILNGMNALIVQTDANPAHTYKTVSENGKWAALNGNDQLIGGVGNDQIYGGTGNDVIIGSAGTDTVDGGARTVKADPNDPNSVITFNDVLLFQESTFVTASNPSASFTITLDPALSLTPTNAGTVEVKDAGGATLGTTTFTNIEEVRTTSNSANDTLNVVALSDAIAAKSAPSLENSVPTNEGVNIFLTEAGGDNYSVDMNGNGILDANEQHIAITDVCGVENVLAGKANDTVTIDNTQLGSNNLINLGSQTDKVEASGHYTLADQGFDLVTYTQQVKPGSTSDIALEPSQVPVTTFTVESAANTDTVASSGGVLGSKTTTDTLVDVERVNFTQAANVQIVNANGVDTGLRDVLDVSSPAFAATGATVNYDGGVTVGKSLGGGNDDSSVANVDANTLSAGGVSATGNGLGKEKVIINGILNFEKMKGSTGNDRVITADDMGLTTAAPRIPAGALGVSSYLGGPTTQFTNIGVYQFDLGAGIDTLDYHNDFEDVAVVLDTSGVATNFDRVISGATDNGAGFPPGTSWERVDYAYNVEQYFGGGNGVSRNIIDLSNSTVDTKIEFSKFSALTNVGTYNSAEIPEPNGNDTVTTTDLTRGILVSNNVVGDAALGTAYATFVDRTASNPTGDAFWTQVQGDAKAETVVFTDNEMTNGQQYTLNLAAGLNVVDYSHLVTSPAIIADIRGVNTTDTNNLSQLVFTPNATTTQFHAGTGGRDANLLTVVAPGHGDTVSIANLDSNGHAVGTANNIVGKYFSSLQNTAAGDPSELIYHSVDLSQQKVTEAVNGYADPTGAGNGHVQDANLLGYVTKVIGFANINNAGNVISGHLTGDGNSNTITAGNGGDWIFGGTGSSGDGTDLTKPGGDHLVAGAGADRFIYTNEVQSPGLVLNEQNPTAFATANDLTKARDSITGFTHVQDQIVFQVDDSYDSVKVTAGTAASQTVTGVSSAGVDTNLVVNISKDVANATQWKQADNYAILDHSGAALTAADLVFDITMSAGANKVDASMGQGAVPGFAVELVYSNANQSAGGSSDSIFNFTTGQDKIDLSQLKDANGLYMNQQADIYNGATNTLNGGILDGADSLAKIIQIGTAIAPNADAAGLFIDNAAGPNATPVNRAIAVEQWNVEGNANSSIVFVDVNHDGNYVQGQDMAIGLVGVLPGAVTLNDFIFNHH